MNVQEDLEQGDSAAKGKLCAEKLAVEKYGEILFKRINFTQTELSSTTKLIAFSVKFCESSFDHATLNSKVETKDPVEAHLDSNVTILKKNENSETISHSVLEDGLQEIDWIPLSIENVKSSIQIRSFASLSEFHLHFRSVKNSTWLS